MRKVKITVIKKYFDPELAQEYGFEGIGPCHFEVEQAFICDRHREPVGFCGEAWKCVQHYAYALYHGSDLPFGEGWMKKPGVVIATCNDGRRPVTFRLERIYAERNAFETTKEGSEFVPHNKE